MSKPLPILCYHKVSRDPADGRWLNVRPERLGAHARFFLRRGREFVTAASLSSNWPGHGVCFTFDDAYESAMTEGVEVLNGVRVKATFYAVSSNVGGCSSWDGDRARPLAGWDALKTACDDGHEIGNHTADHSNLAKLSPAEQKEVVRKCRDELAQHGFKDGSFCYPYGARNEDAARAASACGYDVAMAIGKRPALPTDNLLALPRIVMAYNDSSAMLLYKLYLRPKLG